MESGLSFKPMTVPKWIQVTIFGQQMGTHNHNFIFGALRLFLKRLTPFFGSSTAYPRCRQDPSIQDITTASNSNDGFILYYIYRISHHADHTWSRYDHHNTKPSPSGCRNNRRIPSCNPRQSRPPSRNLALLLVQEHNLVSSTFLAERWHLCPQIRQTPK